MTQSSWLFPSRGFRLAIFLPETKAVTLMTADSLFATTPGRANIEIPADQTQTLWQMPEFSCFIGLDSLHFNNLQSIP